MDYRYVANSNFEEVSITRKEPWGAGIYVAASEFLNCGDKMVVEIQLNSGDMIRITTKGGL